MDKCSQNKCTTILHLREKKDSELARNDHFPVQEEIGTKAFKGFRTHGASSSTIGLVIQVKFLPQGL